MKRNILLPAIVLIFFIELNSCNGQLNKSKQRSSLPNKNQLVGGGCDGCELMFISMPKEIQSVDTSKGWYENGRKLLVTGKVFEIDGKTPASNVIIYYWHTDDKGHYSPGKSMDNRASRHGHIRGWVKTDTEGNYSIYTIRPRAYPDGTEPEHIHILIKEPGVTNEYYIDELVFDDDPLLIPAKKRRPVCKYGRYHGIIYFVGNYPDWKDIKNWLIFLESQSEARKKYLKVYFVYGNENNYSHQARENELEKIGRELNLTNTALTFVPAMNDKKTEANLNKIDPGVKNTFIIYRHRTIIDKYVNLQPTPENFHLIENALNKTQNDYFNLPEPEYQ